MPRKTKYTPEVAQKMFDVLAATGSDRAAFEAAGISSSTFYRWKEEFSEFSEGIRAALSEFRDTCPESLVRQANKAFADYLYGRVEISIATIQRKQLADGSTESTETVRKLRPAVPRWAIERVLGKPLDILEAVKTLSQAGIVPRHLVELTADEVGSARERIASGFLGALPAGNQAEYKRQGLSEETAAAIRAHILGLDQASPQNAEEN